MQAIDIAADDLPIDTPAEYRRFVEAYTQGTDRRAITLFSRNIIEVVRWMLADEIIVNHLHLHSEICVGDGGTRIVRELYESGWWRRHEAVHFL